MIRCFGCKQLTKPGEKPVRKVVETRAVRYPYRKQVHPIIKDGKRDYKDDPGGEGIEIAKEALFCKVCAAGGEEEFELLERQKTEKRMSPGTYMRVFNQLLSGTSA